MLDFYLFFIFIFFFTFHNTFFFSSGIYANDVSYCRYNVYRVYRARRDLMNRVRFCLVLYVRRHSDHPVRENINVVLDGDEEAVIGSCYMRQCGIQAPVCGGGGFLSLPTPPPLYI